MTNKSIMSILISIFLILAFTASETNAQDDPSSYTPYLIAGGIGLVFATFFIIKHSIQGTKPDLRENYQAGMDEFNAGKDSSAISYFQNVVSIYETKSSEGERNNSKYKSIYLNSKKNIEIAQDNLQKAEELRIQRDRSDDELKLKGFLKPYKDILWNAKSHYAGGEFIEALRSYVRFSRQLDSVPDGLQYEQSIYNSATGTMTQGKVGVSNQIREVLKQDTIGIGLSISDCRTKFRASHLFDFAQIDSLDNLALLIKIKENNINKKLLVISGKVNDIQDDVYQIWGTAIPYKTFAVQFAGAMTGLGGLFSLFGNDGMSDIEGVPGVLTQECNIQIHKYNPELKIFGNMVMGQDVAVAGYSYVSRDVGTNALGGTVPIFIYKLSPEQTKSAELAKQRNLLINQRNNLLSAIKLTVDDLNLLKSNK